MNTRRTDPNDVPTSERGWALVSVLWVVTALTLMAAATEELTASSYGLERRAIDRAQTEAVLDAAIARAALGITAPDVTDRWRVDGVPSQFSFNGKSITISIQDELGRFDLNAVDGSMLSALFRAENVPLDESETLVGRILDWRGSTDLHRLHGATREDYTAAGLRYGPRHGPFQSVDELRLVLGMPPDLFERIRPALTVYSKRPMIDPRIATPEALLALYGGDRQKVANEVNLRNGNFAESGASMSTAGFIDSANPLAGRAFSVSAVTAFEGHTLTRNALLAFTEDIKRPYLVLGWQ
jgi:general secretion pathway protein K